MQAMAMSKQGTIDKERTKAKRGCRKSCKPGATPILRMLGTAMVRASSLIA